MIYVGHDQDAFDELRKLAELVGVEIAHVSRSELSQGVLRFSSLGCDDGEVEASFHELFAPYFAKGVVHLKYREDAADLLELMVAVGATVRGRVVGVIGAQGGVGSSTLSAWIARTLGQSGEDVALVDMNPGSVGIDMLLSRTDASGKRWVDLHGRGALLAGRLCDSLFSWHGVKVLSADHRGGVPLNNDQGIKVISALAQVNAWTVLDFAPSVICATSAENMWLEWCDFIVVVTGEAELNLAVTKIKLEKLGKGCPTAVVVENAHSKNHLAHISQVLNCMRVYNLREQKSFDGDIEHGMTPGDRHRSGTAKDVKTICERFLLEVESE